MSLYRIWVEKYTLKTLKDAESSTVLAEIIHSKRREK